VPGPWTVPAHPPFVFRKLTFVLSKGIFDRVPAEIPPWLAHLEDEDLRFIQRFLLVSGSLKELAELYEVSYPTIRLRMDQLIKRMKSLDDPPPADAFDAKVRVLVADGEIPPKLGKELLRIHTGVVKGARK